MHPKYDIMFQLKGDASQSAHDSIHKSTGGLKASNRHAGTDYRKFGRTFFDIL